MLLPEDGTRRPKYVAFTVPTLYVEWNNLCFYNNKYRVSKKSLCTWRLSRNHQVHRDLYKCVHIWHPRSFSLFNVMILSICYYCVLIEFVQKIPVRVCFHSYKRICFGRTFAVQTVSNLNISLFAIQAVVSFYTSVTLNNSTEKLSVASATSLLTAVLGSSAREMHSVLSMKHSVTAIKGMLDT